LTGDVESTPLSEQIRPPSDFAGAEGDLLAGDELWAASPRQLLGLQRRIGNRGVAQVLARQPAAVAAVPAPGGTAGSPGSIADRLRGKEQAYELVKQYRWTEQQVDADHGEGPPLISFKFGQDKLAAAERAATAAVKAAGFADIAAFESSCSEYRDLFRRRAVEIAELALGASERVVRAELARYGDPHERQALFDSLGPLRHVSGEARELAEKGTPPVFGDGLVLPTAEQQTFQAEAGEKLAQADQIRSGLAGTHPILKDSEIPTSRLAFSDTTAEALGADLRETAEHRLRDIERSRTRLRQDPEVVFGLDRVVAFAALELGATTGTIGAEIVADHQAEIAQRRLAIGFMLAALAIGLGLLTFGGGTVAVVAAAGALGVSMYTAVDSIEDYQIAYAEAHSAFDSDAALSGNSPTGVWVALALLGVALDASAVSNALKAARPAVKVFEQTGSAARFAEKLAEARGLSKALQDRLVRAAEAEEAYRGAARRLGDALRASMSTTYAGLDPELIRAATLAAYAAVRKGILSFDVWLHDLRVQRLLEGVDLDRLTPQQSAELREVFASELQREAAASARTGTAAARADPPTVTSSHPKLLRPDPRTAETGGVRSIHYLLTKDNRVSVVIEGRLQPAIAGRAANAPNYNTEQLWAILRDEHHVPGWEAAHLWGPGFGDEAAAGIMLAPREVNQIWQNQGIEKFLRELRATAAEEHATVEVRAVATSLPRGFDGGAGDSFLSHVEYEFWLVGQDGAKTGRAHVEFSVDPPPGGRVHDVHVSPLTAGHGP